MKSKKAFTLAEVLITLAIIGVVAAITVPIIMRNFQDAQYKAAYKEAFSVLSQALDKAKADDLLIDAQSSNPRPSDFDKNFLAIMSEFNVAKQCTDTNSEQCWEINGEKYSNFDYPKQASYAFIDSSGRAWAQYWWGSSFMMVDTNGFKKPNQYGKDRFGLLLPNNTDNNSDTGLPIKVFPYVDNPTWGVCDPRNKCYSEKNYWGTKWLNE